MYEPMPYFDCLYCVTNSARIFKKVSENLLSAKYAPIMLKESLQTYKIKQINRNEEFIKFLIVDTTYEEDDPTCFNGIQYLATTLTIESSFQSMKPKFRDPFV